MSPAGGKPTYRQLQNRLQAAESALEAMRRGEVDVIAGDDGPLVLRLADVEARAEHIKQVLLTIRNVNQLIVSETDPHGLIEKTCQTLTETLGYHDAWVALVDMEDGQTVTDLSISGFPQGEAALRSDLEQGRLPRCMRQALNSEDIVVVRYPKRECPVCPLRKQYHDHAGLSHRLEADGQVYGVLSVSVPVRYIDDTEEQDLFRELAGDLGFALHKIQMGQRLAAQSRDLKRAQSMARLGSWHFDLTRNRVIASREALRIYGLKDEILTIDQAQDIPLPRYRNLLDTALKDLVEHNRPYDVEFEIKRVDDGAIRYVHSTAEYDAEQNLVIGTIQDITNRRQREETVRLQHQQLSFILEGSGLGSWVWNVQTNETVFNETWAAMLGYKLEELEPVSLRTWEKLTHQEDLERANDKLKQVLAEKEPVYQCEMRMRHRDGHWVWILDRGRILSRDADGKPLTMFGTHDNISERKQTEIDLRRSEERYRHLFETMAQGVVYQAADGQIISANPAAERILGVSFEQMGPRTSEDPEWQAINKDGSELAGRDHPAMVALRTARPVRHFIMGVRQQKTGERIWLDVSAIPLFDDGPEKPSSVYATFSDITATRQAQLELAEARELMESAERITGFGSFEYHFSTRKMRVSKGIYRIHGLPVDSDGISPREYFKQVHPEDRKHLIKKLARLRHGQANLHAEYRIIRPDDDTVRYIRATAQIQRDSTGHVKQLVGSLQDITVEQHTLESLEASEERHRLLIENARMGIGYYNLSGDIILCNKLAAEYFGSTPEALTGRNLTEVFPRDIGQQYIAKLQEIAQSETPLVYDEEIKGPQGTQYFLTTASAMRDPSGEVIGIQHIFQDITARRQAEEILQESERELRNVLENVHMIAVSLDKRGRITFANKFLEELTGWKREELIGRDWFQIFIPEALRGDLRADVFEKTLQAGEFPSYHVNPIVTRTGEERIIAWNNNVLIDPKDGVLGITTIGEDITEQQRAADALRESEARARALLDAIPDLMFRLDRQGHILDYEARDEDLSIPEDGSLRGRRIQETLPGEAAQEVSNRIQAALETGSMQAYEYALQLSGQEMRRFEARMVRSGEDEVISIVRDVTEAHREAETRRALEQQLQQSNRLQALGTMVGGIAHEFNNILQGMYLQMELLENQVAQDDALKTDLEQLYRGVKRASHIVRQILTFGRPGQTSLKVQPLQDLLEEALANLIPHLPEKVQLKTSIQQDCGPVACNDTQIHQLVSNIWNNAIHAMGENGGILTLELKEESISDEDDTEKSGLHLSIRDTGTGMEPEILEKVFDPFFSTKPVGEGTGLGLSVVYGIVETMGGQVQAFSEPGKGTEIRFWFPVAGDVEPGFKPTHRHQGSKRSLGLQVLLVEDDEGIREGARTVLENQGCRVTTAANGRLGLEAFQASPEEFDLVITDLAMPEMEGDVLSASIRKIDARIPIVLSSGVLDPALRDRLQEMGMTHFLPKPWSPTDLVNQIAGIFPTDEQVSDEVD